MQNDVIQLDREHILVKIDNIKVSRIYLDEFRCAYIRKSEKESTNNFDKYEVAMIIFYGGEAQPPQPFLIGSESLCESFIESFYECLATGSHMTFSITD